MAANNVVQLDAFRPKPTQDYSQWQWLHKTEYEKRIQILVDEGLIQSGTVVMNELGIPTVYIVRNPSVTTTVTFEANNT